ncbi:hypothetical protein B296_00051206 [Ensete ventricosum]|uniref:Uncharacterized protein n=1 Tax=Ensete ventricosum TaxID=4639 RepID=A0A426XL54_ENSVE|nr:hypothetical protein B296_00051206 [Ensete ventricosum]
MVQDLDLDSDFVPGLLLRGEDSVVLEGEENGEERRGFSLSKLSILYVEKKAGGRKREAGISWVRLPCLEHDREQPHISWVARGWETLG